MLASFTIGSIGKRPTLSKKLSNCFSLYAIGRAFSSTGAGIGLATADAKQPKKHPNQMV